MNPGCLYTLMAAGAAMVVIAVGFLFHVGWAIAG